MSSSATPPSMSVVIATRNAAEMLRPTLRSLSSQTDTNFEIVVIDGASVDSTAELVAEFRNLHIRFVSEPDTGIANAWNKGVRLAGNDWVSFLNAGDLFHPHHVARAREHLATLDHRTIAFCDVIKFRPGGVATRRIHGFPPGIHSIQRGSIGFAHPGSFMTRAAILELGGFDEKLRVALDTDLLLRAFQRDFRFSKFLSCAYMEEGGISDKRFALGMYEFFASARREGLVGGTHARWNARMLPIARRLLHAARRLATPARGAKHAGVLLANALAYLLILASIRRAYFSALGFKLGSSSSIGYGTQFYVPGRLRLGERSVINRGCILDNRGGIEIGSDCSISRDVRIFTAGHDVDSPLFEMTVSPVRLGDHVVVFAGATIMPGVCIGDGAVIYGCAVVTRDVPPMTIVAGNPARVVRRRLSLRAYRLDYEFPLAM